MNQSGPESVLNTKRFVFGVMSHGLSLQKWQAKCIELLVQEGHLPGLLIIDDRPMVRQSFYKKVRKYLDKNGLYLLFQRFFFRPQARELMDSEAIFKGVARMDCVVCSKGFSEYFSAPDVEKIKNHQLDFILRFGFNIIRGEILDAAKYGIWSFHHDDEQKYRGGPPGMWEIVNDDPVTGVILQKLTNKLDSGIMLKKGYFKTVNHSWDGQIDQLFFDAAGFPVQVCRDILHNVAHYFENEPVKTNAPVCKFPKNGVMLGFLYKLLSNKIRFQFEEFFRPESWNVAVMEKQVAEISNEDICKARWFPAPPRGTYFADSFGFEKDGMLKIVFEDWDYKTRKGKISMVDFVKGEPQKKIAAIEEPFHVAYPYIFEHEGWVYCVPESASANQVRLYRYENQKFIFQKVLIDNFPAVDPTLFYLEGLYWIFATHRQHSNTALYAFYAENFDGPYFSHKNNPVKTDIRTARPAGNPFVSSGKLIRPAQDSSVTYGGRTVLNRIIKLTPTEFSEEITGFVEPYEVSEYNYGLHTLSGTGNFSIIDGKKFRFNRHHFLHKLREKSGI